MSEYIPERAMFVCAHPDDLEFGVAGTAAKWAQHGCDVTYVLFTDGNAGTHEDGLGPEEIAAIRRREQQEAADITGVARCIFLGHDDCQLEATLERRKELVRLIRQYKPNVVAAMDPTNFFPSNDYINHPDHRAAGTITVDAVFPSAEMPLLYPDLAAEGLAGHKPNYVYLYFVDQAHVNLYVDITETIDIKLDALRAHKSQLGDWDPADRIKDWAGGSGSRVGFTYAEAFRRITLKAPEADQEGA